jgi:hypothetical protein
MMHDSRYRIQADPHIVGQGFSLAEKNYLTNICMGRARLSSRTDDSFRTRGYRG